MRWIRRTAATGSSVPSSIEPSTESGSTLVACVLVMFGAALLTSSALRSLEDRISLSHSAIDRRVAQHAAEAALQDAALTLTMIPAQWSLAEVQGAHRIGEMTGETYAYGGYMQPSAPPQYALEIISKPDIGTIYRVTAQGKGHSDSTVVILQADFAVQFCKTDSEALQNPVPDAEQGTGQNAGQTAVQNAVQSEGSDAVQNAGKDPDVKRSACVPVVRRLAWRPLQGS